MNRDPPAEGPEHRTQTLSPVSPKPLHFPSPSSIPVLENQMDPVFNDTSTHSNLTLKPASSAQGEQQPSQTFPTATTDDEIGPPLPTAVSPVDTKQPSEQAYQAISNQEKGIENASYPSAPSTIEQPFGHSFAEHVDADEESSPLNYIPLQTSHTEDVTSTTVSANHSGPGERAATQLRGASQGSASLFPHAGVAMQQANGIDTQTLLDNLISPDSASTAPPAVALTIATTQPADYNASTPTLQALSVFTNASGTPATAVSSSMVNLPPRPPSSITTALPAHLETQETPTATPNPANSASSSSSSSSSAPINPYMSVPHAVPPPLPTAGAPGTSNPSGNGLLPPPVPTFQQQQGFSSATHPLNASDLFKDHQEQSDRLHGDDEGRNADADIPWGADIQKKYDIFLEEERKYVLEGQWDRFPLGSRLFIGNLPSEKVTKRDLYHVFHKHGPLAQISIKQAYGFIQYLSAEDCDRALKLEQSVGIRGRKIHLEISKPQRNTKTTSHGEGRSSRNRRSRSPDHNRGGSGGGQRGSDRHRGSNSNRNGRVQDYYRPGRSPSPRRGSGDLYRRRSPDRYDGRRRSRSPYSRSRYRSHSPTIGDDDSTLPLPRRAPDQVPDVQIIAQDQLDRKFVEYIESTFAQRGVRVDVLILSSKLSEAAVMRRQILEGVQAVMKLSRLNQAMQKFQLSVFDRSAGANSVRFEEYDQLELHICVELVVRAKQSKRPPVNDYSVSQYGLPITPALGAGVQASPGLPAGAYPAKQVGLPQTNVSSAISGMDHSSLQQLLDTLSKPQASPTTPQGPLPMSQQPYPSHSQQQQQQPAYSSQTLQTEQYGQKSNAYPTQPAYSSQYGTVQEGGPLSPTHPTNPAQQHSAPDMQNIMAQLARYGR